MTNIQMKTTMGDITIELDAEAAPVSVKNFLEYVNDGFYAGTIFHRVIKGFMIQCGGMDKDMNSKPNNDPIINEAANGLKNDRGTLAMARTSDPDSATSQFFINHADNDFLNYAGPTPDKIGYAVFGKVTEGMDIVDAVAEVETTRHGYHDDSRPFC
jgi:peptidyl-prolyl cis-trans isomerase B (cyclophilin B)